MKKARVLAVDDEPINLKILSEVLEPEYSLELAADGHSALEKIDSFHPSVVLLDVVMPGPDGLDVCRQIKSSHVSNAPQVIFMSARIGTNDRLEGYAAGADDYVTKPFDPEEMLAKVRVHAQLHTALAALDSANQEISEHNDQLQEKVREHAEALVATRDVTVFALAKLADSRDPDTGAHLERLREYAQALSIQLSERGLYKNQVDGRFLSRIYLSSPLHDIGKVGIPDSILLKPGRLTDSEYALMKKHTVIGAEALRKAMERSQHADFLTMAMEIARHHHEHFDGGGYPDGLRGLEIPLSARVVAVADFFDALTSKRCYKDEFSTQVALAMIREERGKRFDPVIVDAVDACLDEFERIFETLGERTEEFVGI